MRTLQLKGVELSDKVKAGEETSLDKNTFATRTGTRLPSKGMKVKVVTYPDLQEIPCVITKVRSVNKVTRVFFQKA